MKQIFITISVLFFFVTTAAANSHHPHNKYRKNSPPRSFVMYTRPIIVIPAPPQYIPKHYHVRHCHPMPIKRHR